MTETRSIAVLIGAIGDLLTFCGGLILAMHEVHRYRELQKSEKWPQVLNAPELKPIHKIAIRDIEVLNKKEVSAFEKMYARSSSRKAVVGTILLCSGFACLLLGRVIELAWNS